MSIDQAYSLPWASFCMSTYNRPVFLRTQLSSLLEQTFTDFEVVVSDNDPHAGAKAIAESFKDARIKYECNGKNIGMVNSFNRSVDRARGQYIVMVTDDDPVAANFLEVFNKIIKLHPGFSLYGGLKRSHTKEDEMEVISNENFINEFLDFDKTLDVLWSSCLFKKEALLQIGKLPDYGGPHLVDHAMLAMAGSIDGAVLVNRMYSNIVLHENNFSKSNFNFYYSSCTGFYNLMNRSVENKPLADENRKVIVNHLGKWFIISMFSLLNFYKTSANYDKQKIETVKAVAEKILQLPYMKRNRLKYQVKLFILSLKFGLGIKK